MTTSTSIPSNFQDVWQHAGHHTTRLVERIGASFPHAAHQGVYQCEEPHWWTAGFWSGILWLFHREDPASGFGEIARQCEEKLDMPLQEFDQLHHDVGFMWILTSVANYELSGDATSRRRALTAASHLAGRFNMKGSYIRAWNPWSEGEDNTGLAIIDCMMNLPLLYWASETTGDPRFRHIAIAHTNMVLNHFIREDGSVHHIVKFNPDTGEVVEALGGQGFAPQSAWARGTSWAMYGLTLSYRYTGDPAYLQAAKKVTHFFLSALGPDGVPTWDFRLPTDAPSYKDSSAGACAASALLELARCVPANESQMYAQHANSLLQHLIKACGNFSDQEEGLLLHGAGHVPEGRNQDNPLIYGDYYFVEALAKQRGYEGLFSPRARY
ncbi:glycosyl hydrolase [Paenibacillus selenitireducens]|uniref:Glycosyl hydrolase n=1 Tax=Paenibacillus selenitireducens TaxID=1324314 RepID=A0A1T2X949_9BACL|nr:glycoside hydrolase family 88 protein [Paenibacillus selenitireducens]OPA76335.1 glycosyl hydrolase [Paenibacillus selenitireducens]